MNFFFSNQDLDDNILKQVYRPFRQLYSIHDLGPNTRHIPNYPYQIIRQDFQIQNQSNQRLQTSLWYAQGLQNFPILVYLHGNSGCRLEVVPLIQHILPHNIGLLAFDFSGSGLSEGDIVTLGLKEVDDLRSVLSYMKQRGHKNFALWGRSMGAVVSLMYSSQRPSEIKCQVLDSAFSSFEKILKDIIEQKMGIFSFFSSISMDSIQKQLEIKTGYDFFTLKPYINAKICSQPAIITYSTQDTIVKCSHSELIKKHYLGQTQTLQFQGEHNMIKTQDNLEQLREHDIEMMTNNHKLVALYIKNNQHMGIIKYYFKIYDFLKNFNIPYHIQDKMNTVKTIEAENISQKINNNGYIIHKSSNTTPKRYQNEERTRNLVTLHKTHYTDMYNTQLIPNNAQSFPNQQKEYQRIINVKVPNQSLIIQNSSSLQRNQQNSSAILRTSTQMETYRTALPCRMIQIKPIMVHSQNTLQKSIKPNINIQFASIQSQRQTSGRQISLPHR